MIEKSGSGDLGWLGGLGQTVIEGLPAWPFVGVVLVAALLGAPVFVALG